MCKKNDRSLYLLASIIALLGIITSFVGIIYLTGGKSFDFVNQYGSTVKIYGDGLYAHDSYFMAPIFRGTDFSILCIGVPLLIIALIIDIKKKTLKNRLFLTSVISLFTYYSAGLAFGVTYNVLHLVYIALFSVSFFGLIIAIASIDADQLVKSVNETLPLRGIFIFLIFTGTALIAAWIPDIILSLTLGAPLQTIEIYTTSITNVLDIGIIGPIAFVSLVQLKKKKAMGYILLEIILTVCTIIGIMVPIQTVFQMSAGIEVTLPVIATKVASFVVLAFFALYFNIKLFKNIR